MFFAFKFVRHFATLHGDKGQCIRDNEHNDNEYTSDNPAEHATPNIHTSAAH